LAWRTPEVVLGIFDWVFSPWPEAWRDPPSPRQRGEKNNSQEEKAEEDRQKNDHSVF